MCASIGVYEKFKLEAYVDGTKFHFSKERLCESPWGRVENGTHPPLAESGEVLIVAVTNRTRLIYTPGQTVSPKGSTVFLHQC